MTTPPCHRHRQGCPPLRAALLAIAALALATVLAQGAYAQTNLALNRPVTVSSTEFPLVGSQAVDGNATTRWASNQSDPQWIYVDLGSSQAIDRVRITWETAMASNYELQTSADASTWTTVKIVTSNTTSVNDHTALGGTGRYVRMYGTTRATTFGYSIFELEIYGPAGCASPAPTTTPGSRCGTGTVALSASSGTAGVFRWYAALTGGTALRTSASGLTSDNYTTASISATTTYFVTFHNGTCESTPRTAIVATINAVPATPTGTAGSRCGAGTVTVSASSATTGTFIWYSASTGGTVLRTSAGGLTSDSYTTPSISATTNYFVSVRSAANCEGARRQVTATVNALPTAFNVTGTATICAGNSATISLSGSQTGVNYQLRLNGVNTGAAVAGTGAALAWAGQTTAGPYTIVATNATTGCTNNMSGTATLTVNALPTLFAMTGTNNFCGSGTLNLGLGGSQSGTTYQLRRDGTNVGTAVSGTGSAISFPAQTAQGTYTVMATRSGCTLLMTGSARISPLPAAPTVIGTSRCGTGTATVTANSSTAGTFTWYSLSSGGSVLQTSAAGLTSNAYTITTLAATTTYYVTVKDANGCESSPRTAITATVNTTPPAFNITGGGASCSAGLTWTSYYVTTTPTSITNINAIGGGSGPLAISNETLPAGVDGWVEFTAVENGLSSDKVVGFKSVSSALGYATDYGVHMSQSAVFVDENSVRRDLVWPYFTPGDLFRVERVGTTVKYYQNGSLVYTSTVPSTTTLQAYVMLNNSPSIQGIQTSFAPVASRAVNLSSSVTGVNYQLRLSGTTDIGTPLAGTGSALQWNVTSPGTYTVVATNTSTSCTNTMSGTATVTVAATPRTYLLTGGVNLPSTLSLAGSQSGVNYQLRMNGANVGAPIAGTGSALTWNVTNVGAYNVVAVNATNGCSATMSGTIATEIGLVPDQVEFNALKDLFTSTNGANWTNKTNWPTTWPATATSAQMATWFGVTVANGDVTGIELAGNNLNGPLPATLGNLTELNSLGLRANSVTGAIPASWASMTKLTSLNLAYTLISGELPGYLNTFTNLNSLQIVAGNVTGQFPDLSNLSGLQALFLEANFTAGPIPQYIANLTSLTHLMISNTNRNGLIPAAIGNLPQLQVLELSNNQLTGPVPNTLGSKPSLWSINLSFNQLSGTIPQELGKPSIGTLRLNNNQLTGSVPTSFRFLTGINNLNLRSNQLEGTLPSNLFENMPYLTNLELSNNRFTGEFPSVAGCIGLSLCSFFNNGFTSLHPSFISRPNLYWLEISGNEFRTLPDLTQQVNKINLQLMIDGNLLDFTVLQPLSQAGFARFYAPFQKPINDNSIALVTNQLRINARPKTANTTITWWKKQANGSWADVSATNQDATGLTYLRTAATVADEGIYQWRATNSVYPWPMVLQSTEIEARQGPSATDSQVLYNGLITTARWRTDKAEGVAGLGFKGMYHYTYDDKYQIKEANFSDPVFALNGYETQGNKYRLANMSYDPNGNIQTLRRFNGNGQVQHDFNYTYKPLTNQLQGINGYANYTYNAIGQMTVADKAEANADQYVDYDVTGKVVAVYKDADKKKRVTEYRYDDRGFRIAKITYPATDGGEGLTTWYIRDASGNVLSVYEQRLAVPTASSGVPIEWTGMVNTAVTNGNLVQPTPTNWGTSYATSVQQLPANTDGWVESTFTEQNSYSMFGLAESTYGHAGHSPNFGIYATNDPTMPFSLVVFENGAQMFTLNGKINEGDKLRVERTGTNIFYKRNGTTFYTSTLTTSSSLFAKASFSVGSYGPMGYGLGILVNPVCSFGTANLGTATQKEIPIYGSGKIGTYYPANSQLADQAGHEAGSTAYELTDHLGNVRALLRTHANEYTATMEDDGTATYTNPRVRENVYFKNLWTTEKRDVQMNHTSTVTMPQGYAPANSAYLYWVSGQAGNGPQQKSVGPAIALAVNAGDRISASAWARFKIKASYSRAPIQNIIASVLSGQYAYSNGLESITQATNAFNAGLVGLGSSSDPENNRPYAYLNCILFDTNYNRINAIAPRVPLTAGFEDPQQRGNGYTNANLIKFAETIEVTQPGYVYIFVSNESENTEVWFDDLNVIHQKTLVAEATDYGVWGDVMREQKWEDLEGKYRYGYQGKYAERDEETGWNHFELREYDPVVGRWFQTDPEGQFCSPYIGMANNPVTGVDPNGGYFFGLFGSTREQRQAARQFAAITGGEVLNITSAKNIAVSFIERTEVDSDGLSSTTSNIMEFGFYGKDDIATRAWDANMNQFIWENSGPSPGNIDFDPLTQFSLGMIPSSIMSASSKIVGAAQSTGTIGHATLSRVVAMRYALDPRVARVTLNMGYKRLMGHGAFRYGPRPDVGVLWKSGKVTAVEIGSKTDKAFKLMQRNSNFMKSNGIVGDTKVIDLGRLFR